MRGLLARVTDTTWAGLRSSNLVAQSLFEISFRATQMSDATALASHIHAEQSSKNTDIPHISYRLGVVTLVLEHGGDEEQAMAALSHDAVRDQDAHQLELILGRFGTHVVEIVESCTDADTLPKPPWQALKQA